MELFPDHRYLAEVRWHLRAFAHCSPDDRCLYASFDGLLYRQPNFGENHVSAPRSGVGRTYDLSETLPEITQSH
jgi:hypothetical protein